jgi:hypothetical protein
MLSVFSMNQGGQRCYHHSNNKSNFVNTGFNTWEMNITLKGRRAREPESESTYSVEHKDNIDEGLLRFL